MCGGGFFWSKVLWFIPPKLETDNWKKKRTMFFSWWNVGLTNVTRWADKQVRAPLCVSWPRAHARCSWVCRSVFQTERNRQWTYQTNWCRPTSFEVRCPTFWDLLCMTSTIGSSCYNLTQQSGVWERITIHQCSPLLEHVLRMLYIAKTNVKRSTYTCVASWRKVGPSIWPNAKSLQHTFQLLQSYWTTSIRIFACRGEEYSSI